MKKETRQKAVFWLSFVSAIISAVLLLGFVIAQTYVRWVINQNFLFLGGFELEALTLFVVVQIVALAYIHRSEN